LQEYKAAIDGISASYSCETIYKAVGKEPGHLEINVAPDDPQLSSLLERSDLTAEGLKSEKRTIEVTTLDSIFAGKQLPAKTLLKIDTEGNELAVLQGAEEILPRIDCVIAEASIAPRFKDGYRFDDLVAFLADRGFELYSFLYITHKVEEMQPRFADVVFMRSDAAATGNG